MTIQYLTVRNPSREANRNLSKTSLQKVTSYIFLSDFVEKRHKQRIKAKTDQPLTQVTNKSTKPKKM